MKRRSEYKKTARKALKGNYETAIVAMFVISAVSYGMSLVFRLAGMGNSLISQSQSTSLDLNQLFRKFPFLNNFPQIRRFLQFSLPSVGSIRWSNLSPDAILRGILISVIQFLTAWIVGTILNAGQKKLHMNIVTGEKASVGDVFWGFVHGFWRFLVYAVLLGLLHIALYAPSVFLAGLGILSGTPVLFLVAAPVYIAAAAALVVLVCAYSQTVNLMVKYPQCGAIRAMRTSRVMMRGHKWQFFVLDLSFIGMVLLELMSFLIGSFWIQPYIWCTKIAWFLDLERNSLPPVSSPLPNNAE